eukprot:scaffold2234_cov66-Phaeocystis_antarctica.AAC.10
MIWPTWQTSASSPSTRRSKGTSAAAKPPGRSSEARGKRSIPWRQSKRAPSRATTSAYRTGGGALLPLGLGSALISWVISPRRIWLKLSAAAV